MRVRNYISRWKKRGVLGCKRREREREEISIPCLHLQSNSPSPHLCPRGTPHLSQFDSQINASAPLLAPVALRASSCLHPVYPLLQCWDLCAPLFLLFWFNVSRLRNALSLVPYAPGAKYRSFFSSLVSCGFFWPIVTVGEQLKR